MTELTRRSMVREMSGQLVAVRATLAVADVEYCMFVSFLEN